MKITTLSFGALLGALAFWAHDFAITSVDRASLTPEISNRDSRFVNHKAPRQPASNLSDALNQNSKVECNEATSRNEDASHIGSVVREDSTQEALEAASVELEDPAQNSQRWSEVFAIQNQLNDAEMLNGSEKTVAIENLRSKVSSLREQLPQSSELLKAEARLCQSNQDKECIRALYNQCLEAALPSAECLDVGMHLVYIDANPEFEFQMIQTCLNAEAQNIRCLRAEFRWNQQAGNASAAIASMNKILNTGSSDITDFDLLDLADLMDSVGQDAEAQSIRSQSCPRAVQRPGCESFRS